MDYYPSWETAPTMTKQDDLVCKILEGEKLMFCRNDITANSTFPRHRHAAEQFAYIISGKLRMYVADTERIVSAGDVVHVPSNEEHGADVLDEDVVLLEIYSPSRSELLEAAAAQANDA
jgi:quercetin dioxygenase-like cupin family protein